MNWITHEPEDVYHSRSKSGEFMSSHLLADFRNSPLLFHKKICGLVTEPSNPAFAFGSAAHKFILEGREAFDEAYNVADGPINERTGEPYGKTTKAYQSWLDLQDREIVSTEDFGRILDFDHSVQLNETARRLLSDGEAEGVARAELSGVPCQIRMDFFNPNEGLVDLNTTAELRYFENDARRFGYVFQMAFYRAVIRILTGVTFPVHIIAVEKCEPYACGVWLLSPNCLDDAERVNAAALERFKMCVRENLWPTGYETVRLIDSI